MKVVFMGTPEQALPSLEAILAAGHQVPLVVTQPDRPAGRSKALVPPAVKSAALLHGLRVIQPAKVRTPEFLETIVDAEPDVLAVVAYGRLLVRPVLHAARYGAVNLHFSLLPSYRGAAPVQWALAHGDAETGVTTFRLDEGLDTGDIWAQRRVAVEPDEHAPALLARLAEIGAKVLLETLEGMEKGTIAPRPQSDVGGGTAPILRRDHGSWDKTWTGAMLEGRVRGFDPWPGVWAARLGQRIRIVAARAVPGTATDAAPGTILDVGGDAIRLACASGSVALVSRVQRAGGRELPAREAVNGRILLAGDRLEPPIPAA